jgi:CheY-like chemotaxis protein
VPKCRVLVVDENTAFRDSLIEFLNGKDFEAYRALDAMDALVQTLGGHPQFVLWALPDSESWGFDFLTHIKCAEPDVLVIACSDGNLNYRPYDVPADYVVPKGQWTGIRLLACIEELKNKRQISA